MPTIRCSRCEMVFLPEEVTEAVCISCGAPIMGGPTLAPVKKPMPRRQFRVIAVGVIAFWLGVGGVLLLMRSKANAPPTRPAVESRGSAPVRASVSGQAQGAIAAADLGDTAQAAQFAAPATQPAKRPAEQLVDGARPADGDRTTRPPAPATAPSQAALAPMVAAAGITEPAEPGDSKVADVAPIVSEEDGVKVRRFNDPAAEYRQSPLNGHEHVKLVGKIKALRIGDVNGSSVLDASQLEAGEIIVEGAINGETTIKLNAPSGKVHLTKDVNGTAVVEINAPGGSVTLRQDRTAIGGGTNLYIATRELLLRGTANGGTRISVMFNRNGFLKFQKMDGGAQATWFKAEASDPDVQVDSGEIRAGATIRQSERDPAFPANLQPSKDAFKRNLPPPKVHLTL